MELAIYCDQPEASMHRLYGDACSAFFRERGHCARLVKRPLAEIGKAQCIICHDDLNEGRRKALRARGVHIIGGIGPRDRGRQLRICEDVGLPVVPWTKCLTQHEVRAFASKHPGPLVAKRSGYGAMKGVEVIHPDGEAPLSFLRKTCVFMTWCSDPTVYRIVLFRNRLLFGQRATHDLSNKTGVCEANTHDVRSMVGDAMSSLLVSAGECFFDRGCGVMSIDLMMYADRLHVIEVNPNSIGVRFLSHVKRFREELWQCMLQEVERTKKWIF